MMPMSLCTTVLALLLLAAEDRSGSQVFQYCLTASITRALLPAMPPNLKGNQSLGWSGVDTNDAGATWEASRFTGQRARLGATEHPGRGRSLPPMAMGPVATHSCPRASRTWGGVDVTARGEMAPATGSQRRASPSGSPH